MSNNAFELQENLPESFYEIWYNPKWISDLTDAPLYILEYNKSGIPSGYGYNESGMWVAKFGSPCNLTRIHSYEAPQKEFSGTYKEAVTWLKQNDFKLFEGRLVETEAELDA